MCMCAKLFQSCPTPSNPMVHSPPGSSVHGILQARTLVCVAFPTPEDLPDPATGPAPLTSPELVVSSLPLVPPGKPILILLNLNFNIHKIG